MQDRQTKTIVQVCRGADQIEKTQNGSAKVILLGGCRRERARLMRWWWRGGECVLERASEVSAVAAVLVRVRAALVVMVSADRRGRARLVR